ncbi:MAG TPA: hypothetical protein VF069_24255 [Streptosporangiaceae bacterium]
MIAILTSGFGLGVHVPGLLLDRRLAELGVRSRVDVLERYWPPERRSGVAASKRAYQRDFRMARLGQRLFRSLDDAFDDAALDALTASWREEGVERFVVFSGFWLPVVDRYLAGTGAADIRVDTCHVDAIPSPSFARQAESMARHRTVWLVESGSGTIPWQIRPSTEPIVPWADREERFLAHGGGWGMGTYLEYAAKMAAKDMPLDVVVRSPDDITALRETAGLDARSRFFMMDPEWSPWQDTGFPPFGEVVDGAPPAYRRWEPHHEALLLTRKAVGVVSKPGGGTLVDAFGSATPLVFVDSFGEHEQHNARVWEDLGFGISFTAWEDSGFSIGLLEDMHRRILGHQSVPADYAAELAALVR